MAYAKDMQIAENFKQEFEAFNTCFSDFMERCSSPNISIYNFSLATSSSYKQQTGFWHITCAVCFSWIHYWRDGVVQTLLSKDTAVLAETGDSWFNCQKLKLPEGCGWAWLLTICYLQCKISLWIIYLQAIYFCSHWKNIAFVLKLHFN